MHSYSFNKTKKAAIMASILGSSLFAGSAFAANLLVTVPSDYSTSNMAVITGSRVTTNVDSNPIRGALESLNRDPSAYAFIMDGKSKFLLRQYNYSTSTLIPSQVLDADTDWDNPQTATGTITKAANPHSAAGYNGYLYTGDYDLGTISVSKVNEKTLNEDVEKSVNLFDDINQYCGGSLSHAKNAWVHGEGITIKGDSLYVVVSVNPEGGYNPYDDSYLMEYRIQKDGSLKFNSYTRTVRNPDSVRLESYNNLLMHTGIGGYQYVGEGNSTTNISIADISNGYLSDKATIAAVLPENVKNAGLDFRNMSVWPNGTVYILAYNLSSSGGGSHMMVYKTTVANLNSSNPKDWEMVIERNPEGGGSSGTATGWFNSLFTEYYTKRIWGEFGNEIVVYTDGAKEPTLSWTAYNLANNKIYHTFNSVALLKGDSVYGDKALLTKTQEEGLTSPSATTTSVVNLNANMKKADYTKRITGTSKDTLYTGVTSDNTTYTFTADKVIGLGVNSWKEQADLSNNILAAIYAHDGNNITVDAGKNTLQLQVQNYVATPVGVYAGNGKSVTINAGKLNVITAGVKGGNSLTNAIMNDAGKDKASKITINGDVNISMSGSYGGNGVAIQKTDRWGEASYESTVENTITINGDLNIKGADSATWGIPLNEENVFSRFNNAGILTQVENSRVDVSGLANMDVYGNGITTNAKNSTVSIGGGEINVPKGMQYSYYTLGAYQGTINVNTGRNGDTVGSNDVKLGGDIFALKTGTINVALTTAASYLNGIVDNGGTVNMWLQNGATWTNVQNNERYEQDNEDIGSNGLSHVTKLVGGSSGSEGVIFQKAASKDITVDNYSGSTMVIYEHDSKTPTSILGGNFTVGKAAADSVITLRTDSSGIDMSSDSEKNSVLNALANKLYYTGYVNGEKNLSGYVQLAEGLTAASETAFYGNIKYSSNDGQGSLDGSGISTKQETPVGDNTEDKKDFLVDEGGEWKGSTSGDDVKLTMNNEATWTGDNSGKNFVLKALEAIWKGNNSGVGSNISLVGSMWEGNNTAKDVSVAIDGSSSWTGSSSGDGFKLSINDGGVWKVKGDSVLDIFNGGSQMRAKMLRAAGTPVVDMTDAEAGNVTVNSYNGSATVIYAHDAQDSTKILGGNFTVKQAGAGSTITLVTDNTGVEASNKYSINDTLNALANKLYYTGAVNGEKNLSGTVRIAEGLTAVSASKYVGGISYGKDGQGSLDKGSVDYGKDFPTAQNKTSFSTGISGDYVADKEYRDAGVLPDTDNIYNFTKDATTITTDGSTITTAKDTTLKVNGKDLTLKSTSGDGIATSGGTLTVDNAGKLVISGANAVSAKNSKVTLDAQDVTLTGGVSAAGTGSKVTAKNVTKLAGNVTTDTDASSELSFAEGATWTGDNAGTSTISMSKGTWTGANSGKLNATLTNGTTWTGDSTGAGSTISLDKSKWNGANSGANATITATNGSAWSKGNSGEKAEITLNASTWNGANTGDNVTVKADKSIWTGDNSGKALGVTLTNGASWNGANTGDSATVGLIGSTWTGDNSGAGLSLTADNSKWAGNALAAGKASLSNGSSWTGYSSADNFALTLNASTWYNTGVSKLASFAGTSGVVDMTAANAGNVTIGSYSGDATVIYAHDAKDVTNVLGGNFTVGKAAAGSKLTLVTDNTGVDTTDEDSINGALNALANKLYYTGYINGEQNLSGYVKLAEGLTATSAQKQLGDIKYDDKTGQGSLDSSTVKPGPTYPTEQDRTTFVTSITGDHQTDKEYRKAGVLSNTEDNNIYNFTKDATTITTDGSTITTAKDTTLKLNGKDLTIKSTAGDGIATSGGTLTVDNAGKLVISGSKAVSAKNSKVTINAADVSLSGGVEASGTGSKVTAKNISKLDGDVKTDASASAELSFAEGATWTGDNAGTSTISMSKGSWNGANIGKLNATLTNGASWNGANTGTDATVGLTGSTWTGDNSGASLTLTADNSKWAGNALAAGKASLSNGSTWTGYSSADNFALTLNASTWYNTGVSKLASFTGTSGVVDMTAANAGNVTIGSYSGDATVIYKHDAKDVTNVLGGNFTVGKAAVGSKLTLVTDNTGVDTTDEDSINGALNALANKLYYTGYINGEKNLSGYVKLAEGLTATSAQKQLGDIKYDSTTGQGSLDSSTVKPGPTYPTEQDRTTFVTSITGEHQTDKEYRKAGVLSNTEDNNIYNFTKDATTITTDGSTITTAKDTTLKLNGKDLTLKSTAGDGIATSGGTLTVDNAGKLVISGSKAVSAKNSKVTIAGSSVTANGAVSASGANSSVSIKTTGTAEVGAISADGANSSVGIEGSAVSIAGDVSAAGTGSKVTAKNISKLAGNVTTDADASAELSFAEGATWTGDNAGTSTISMSNGTWNGANSGKLNATLTNGTTWTGDSTGAGSTISLDKSTWNGANSGANATITATNGAGWSKGNSGEKAEITLNASTWTGDNTGDNVTVKADKSTWTGDNSGKALGVTLKNGASWNGANTGDSATVSLTGSTWTGDNSGAGLSLTADNSKWAGNALAAGKASLSNGSSWTGYSSADNFALTLNASTWYNTGISKLASFAGTSGVVDMTAANAGNVTIGSYSGDATVIYKHDVKDVTKVLGGNFTVSKAAAGSKLTLVTDNTGVDTTDEDSINGALNALANKLYYTGYINGEKNLSGYVKLAEGLTATSAQKQLGDIKYDSTTGQGSLDSSTVKPGPTYPTEQDRTTFVTSITGDHQTDKEYRKAGVLSNTEDNNIYNFTKDATTITTDGSTITTAKDTTLKVNGKDLTLKSTSGDGIATSGGTLTVDNAGKLVISGANAVSAKNSKVTIAGSSLTANGAVSASGANSSVSIKTTGTAEVGAISADGANSSVGIEGSAVSIAGGVSAAGTGSKVTAKNISKLDGDVTTDTDASAELSFAEGATWTGDNAGTSTISMSKGTWNGANSGKLNATLTNGTTWTGDSTGAGSTISLDKSTWNGANSGANATITATNGAGWSKGNSGEKAEITLNASSWTGANTGDNVTVKADKSTWTGNNSGKALGVTLTNGAGWNGANTGADATVGLTGSSWTGDNSGAGLTLTADNSKWEGNVLAAGKASLSNGSTWTGYSSADNFDLTLNASTWYNTGVSKLASFAGANGVVDMTAANAGDVTIGSYSGDATVIYAHDAKDVTKVNGGNFTVGKAAAGSKLTLVTDNTGVDTTDEDSINGALNALANKLYYTGYINGEQNLSGYVKIAEGLTATSAQKQLGDIKYDSKTGQGSLDSSTVKPGPTYPTEQDRTTFVTSITGEHQTDKEYRKAGVLSNTEDNNIYNFTKDATTITTDGSTITTAKDTTLKLNGKDLTIKSTSGDGIATSGGTLTVDNAGKLVISGANAVSAKNSKVTLDAQDVTLTGDVSASGTGSKVTVKNVTKLAGNVTTDTDASAELSFAEGATWTGDNAGTSTISMSKGTWNGANSGKLNATLTNGTTWTGDSTGAGSTISLDKSTWNGANSGANATITATNGASWSKGNSGEKADITLNASTWTGANTGDNVTVKADKSSWTGDNSGKALGVTLTNGASWNGANTGENATVGLTGSTWTGDNSGAGLTLTADNSKWAGNALAAGKASLSNGSTWTGYSSADNFDLTLNASTWYNTGVSKLASFAGANGVVDMTAANAGNVTIGSYSGDATVIYKHDAKDVTNVLGGNFTVGKAAAGSKLTLVTDNTGVDTTDEDSINGALNALANKLYYTGYINGEKNLSGYVKLAEGLTATSAQKQLGDIKYDDKTGQGSLDSSTVKPGPTYPTEQDRTAFVTSITGEHQTDKEYRKAGVLSNTEDNNIYNFTKDATTITTDGSTITTAKDTTLKLNGKDLTLKSTAGDGIVTSGGTLTVDNAGKLVISGSKAVSAKNSKVTIAGSSVTANGAVSASGANSSVSIKTTDTAEVGAISADGANSSVGIEGSAVSIAGDVSASGTGSKVTAKNISKLAGNVTTDTDASAELSFAEGATWTGDNAGTSTISMSKGTWNGANSGKLNATLTNGTTWTGDSTGAGSTISLDKSTWNGANSGANATITATNGASWSKGNSGEKAEITLNASTWNGANTGDNVTVKVDKSTWTGDNSGKALGVTLTNGASWNGANTGTDATVGLTGSTWTGDNSGAGLTLTADNSKWAGNALADGKASLSNGSSWTGYSSADNFALTLNASTWYNTGVSKLASFTGTSGVVDMTAANAGDVTIGSYSGDATVIYAHDAKDVTKVNGGNFTVGKAAAGSKLTLVTDRNGIDMTDEDAIDEALNALAGKLYYTGYADGEKNLSGYVKIAEGLTASAVVKQTGDIQYDAKTGQGSLKDGSVTPGIDYPTEQTKESFTSQITGEWKQDKEYKLAGVLPVDNATYSFSKDLTTITTEGTSVGAAKDVLLKVNEKNLSLKSGADAVKADAITVTIDAVNNLDITAADKALLAENGGQIIINNKGLLTSKSALAAEGSGSVIKIKGLADIDTGSGAALTAADGSIELAGGSITGVINASGSGRIDINMQDAAAGSNTTKITGDVAAADSSIINIGLGNAESSLKGNVAADGESQANIMAKDGASWLGSGTGNVNVTLDSKASWTNTGSSSLKSLKGDGGVVDQTQDGAGDIRVADYSGDVTVLYKHTATTDADGKLSDLSFNGGNFTIDKAAEGSTITLKTDRSGLSSLTDTANVEKLMSELAKKLFYNDAANNADNLKGTLVIGEGLTAASASKAYGSIEYDANGQAGYKEGSLIRTDPEIIYGSSETAMMRGAKSAMASTALLWRTEANDMQKRLGDIRLAQEESGLWAKYYGGKTSYDANNTKYQTKFNAYQLGYDKNINNNLLFGISMSYNKGNNTYDLGGRGDGKAVSVAAYGTWLGDNGHYADVIIKGSKLDNDYKVYNDMGHKLEGNYDTWGLSLSAEYGRRMSLNNGFYVDPSVEFTVGRINSADYSAASDFLDSQGRNKYMAVNQDAFTSAVARFGLGLGRTTEKGSFYTKLAWAHEFSGDFTTTFAAEGEPTSGTKVDFGGSWCEWQLGGSVNVNDNSYVYATFEKKFGGDAGSNDWRLDAGLRWSF